MRSTEGNEDKDNDRGRKSRRGRIKLSTHLLGRVSAALGMKTLNPTVAQKGRNSRLDMSYYLSLGPNIHLPQTPASSSLLFYLLVPACSFLSRFRCSFFFFFSLRVHSRRTRHPHPTNQPKKEKQKRAAGVQSEEAKSDVMSRALCFYNSDTRHPGEWFYSSEGDRATVRDYPAPHRPQTMALCPGDLPLPLPPVDSGP